MVKLADIIAPDLVVLFIGFNPSLRSAAAGHHFAGPNNRFWRILYDCGLTLRLLQASDDQQLLRWGMGLTNIVARPTQKAAQLTTADYRAGAAVLQQKLLQYRPQVACYVGFGVYRAFARHCRFSPGLQETSVVPGILDFAAASTSGWNRKIRRKVLSL